MNDEHAFQPEQFPSNSSFKKTRDRKEIKEKSKLQKIVTGVVKKQKPGLIRRISGVLMGSDSRTTKSYVIEEILIPATKNLIVETIYAVVDGLGAGFEMLFFGEKHGRRHSIGRRSGGGSRMSYIGYNSLYSSENNRQRHPSVPGRYVLCDVLIEDRGEAQQVLEDLFDQALQYGYATVADYYALVGIDTEYTDVNYGWSDLRGSQVVRVNNGYILDLPKPQVIPD